MIQKTILAIDYGTKKIGLALKKKAIYQPEPINGMKNQGDIPFKILELCKRENIELVLLGLPLDAHGMDTMISLKVRDFEKILRVSLPKKIEIQFTNERNSTLKAQNLFRQNPKKQKSWEHNKDSLAAMVILEDFLVDYYQHAK